PGPRPQIPPPAGCTWRPLPRAPRRGTGPRGRRSASARPRSPRPPWRARGPRRRHSRRSFLLDLGADLQRLGFGDGLHPVTELDLVVQQACDVRLRVLELGAPEQGIEGTHLDADPAIHAQAEVDVEAVQHADGSVAPTGPAGWPLLLVPL